MFKIEQKLIEWVQKNILVIFVAVATLLSVLARVTVFSGLSEDATHYLIPWYDQIKEAGGLAGLSEQVGDYNILYQTIIALFTYLPIPALYAYKILSCVFDYLLAGAVGYLVYNLADNNKFKAYLAFVITLFAPVVLIDSAWWAQCDSIYTFFVVLTIIYLMKERYVAAFVALGWAFAFKLQAIFVLPFVLFYYFYKKRFTILYFLLIPVMMILSSTVGFFYGRTVKDVIKIYFLQTQTYSYLSMNYASFWNFLQENKTVGNCNSYAMLFAIIALAIVMIIAIQKKIELTQKNILYFSYLLTYTAVMFMPCMHERYDYIYMILGIAIVMLERKFIAIYLGMSVVSLMSYSHFITGNPVEWKWLAILNVICYVCSFKLLGERMYE